MIQLCITVNSRHTGNHVAEFLVKQKLVLRAMVSQEVTEVSLREVQLLHRSRICITAVTKALLFTTIEKKLQEFLSDEDFELYAVPVVNMDWEQADRLRSDIEKA